MTFAVFIHRSDSIYDDSPAERYQFPPRYLGRVQACVGDWIVYYEPRKIPETRGYFAVAKVQQVIPDSTVPGMYLALIEPGSYLVHASFGRAGATKRIKVGTAPARESLVLEAGGLKLDAVLSGGVRIPPHRLRFSIYEADPDFGGERALIVPNVSPNTVVRLNAGTYHVVSTYGSVNAVIRSDIRVEAGKLTEATVEHRAAELTMKLVREPGGEAIADTSWSILTDSGDIVRESVGAFASMVLAEGDYAIVAKNRDRIYQREFTVVPGRNQDVEVIADHDSNASPSR
jgi:hypothetical protein